MQMRAEEQKSTTGDRTLKELTPNVAALLCYVGGWISGIVFLVLEQKNRFVRYHALQSIIVFGTLTLAGAVLGALPIVGVGFHWIIGILGFVLWLILMLKAYAGESYKMPWAGNLAERLANESMGQASPGQPITPQPSATSTNSQTAVPPIAPEAANPAYVRPTKGDEFRARYYSWGARAGRITASAFAIAWSLALIIFFNFYNQYIAYYQFNQNTTPHQWQMHTLITSDFQLWLPILTLTLALTIAGHIILIVFDKYFLRQIVRIILAVFGIATIFTLLSIFPFNFNVIPNSDAAFWAQTGLTILLIIIAVGIGIGALVRFIQLIVYTAQGKY